MNDTKVAQKTAKVGVGELGAVVGDEMPEWSKAPRGGSKELLNLSGRRLCGKDASGERHPGEGVEEDADLEMKEGKLSGSVLCITADTAVYRIRL